MAALDLPCMFDKFVIVHEWELYICMFEHYPWVGKIQFLLLI